jgi:hypothetical protein
MKDSMLEEQLETVEINGYLEMGEALAILENDPNFKKVIVEGYFGQSVKDSVSLLSEPAMSQHRVKVMEDLIAVSNLQYYFQMVKNFHAGAVQDSSEPALSDLGDEE